MSKLQTVRFVARPNRFSRSVPAGRQLLFIGVLATFLPLAALAALYLLAPLPLTPAAVQTLHRANQFAAIIVGANWAFLLFAAANGWLFRVVRQRLGGMFASSRRATA